MLGNLFNRKKSNNFIGTDEREKITIGQLALAVCFILLSFSSCTTALNNRALSSRQVTNVQLLDGTNLQVQREDPLFRSDETLTKFTKEWYSLMFSWDGKIPGTSNLDKGVKTNNKKQVPATAWLASLMMTPKFAQGFLDKLTEFIPEGVFSGGTTCSAIVRYISPPKKIRDGIWEINAITDQIRLIGGTPQIMPFNYTIRLKAVPIPSSPLKENANVLDKTIYKMRIYGLEIESLTPYEP